MTTVLTPPPAPPDHVPPPAAGAERPSRAAAARISLRKVTAASVGTVLAALLGGVSAMRALTSVLPFSGVFGFWLCSYLAFLGLYAALCATQWPGKVVADKLIAAVLVSAGLLVLVVVADQVIYVSYRGWDAVQHPSFFTKNMTLSGPLDPVTSGGIVHALVGSLEQLGLATLFSVPLGILAALFLVEVGGPLAKPVRTIVEAMTALPEIIAGLFVYALLILTFGFDPSGFCAAVALAVTMLPIVTRASEVVLRLVPGGLREASYALGASQARTLFIVVLPTARSGLATAVILGMARAVGETSPVLLTSGVTAEMNASPFSGPQVSLPLYIFTFQQQPQAVRHAQAFGAALTLMIMVLVLFALARLIGGKPAGQLSRRQQKRLSRVPA